MEQHSLNVTIELTNYCPRGCKYCSSNATSDMATATFITVDAVKTFLGDEHHGTIVLSGGEPLAHPKFYEILQYCKQRSDDVVVYTNELTHVAYNANIIDDIYIEAMLNVADTTRKVRVLKRITQGRETYRPEVTFSRNFDGECTGCGERVLRPDGSVSSSPCRKDVKNDVE